MTKRTNSGDGERIAMLGYVPQYEIAAGLIYEALLNGSLEWFRVADPEAGSVDDILIATTGRLDAYQVKWAEYTTSISYSDFVRDSKTKAGIKKPSLYEQLTEGWLHLTESHKKRLVKVHLLHKLVPSSNTTAEIPIGEIKPQHAHFQSFLKDCWFDRSWCQSSLDVAPECWKGTLLDLKSKSKLNDDDFLSFIYSCELEFNYKRPSEIPITNKGQARRQSDIEKIYNLLTKMAGGEQRIIEMSKDAMLDKLSWNHKFQHKFVHEFPIDRTYKKNEGTVDAISNALSQKNKGYIALLGGPGSGKSTTLTHTLKYKAGYKLIRYYAYVPDSTYQGRGEANIFLHDITLSLKNHGFRGESSGQPESREEYLSLLGEQFQQAHDKWKSDDVTTIIMVDGLDHIQREQSPQHSLLSDLPLPNTIPDGVIFILGTQTLELNDLSPAIKNHIKRENGAIYISSLTKSSVYAIIEEWPDCSNLTDYNKKEIFEKSLGHPLYLIYLLQFIVGNPEKSSDEVINYFPAYEGHIEQNYSIYWSQMEANHGLAELLALLSRVRVPINTKDLAKWADDSIISQFIFSAAHYFNKDTDGNWRFFHNSFRQFILDKTSRNLFGDLDESKNIDYHKKLADYCQTLPASDPMHAEVIFHLFKAEKFESVIEIGQQKYFREQFTDLRNLSNITDDIDFTLLSAKEVNEPLAVIRCILIESELKERNDPLSQIDMLNLLFHSEGVDSAFRYAFDGESLLVSDHNALVFSKLLTVNGFLSKAKIVFDAAEPLGYLSGSDEVNYHNDGDTELENWIDAAYNFIPLDSVVSTIFQTRYKNDEHEERDNEELHYRLINKLINSIYETKIESKIEDLFFFLSREEKLFDNYLYLCFSIGIGQFPLSLKSGAFQVVIEWSEKDALDTIDKLRIAELDYKTNGNIKESEKWLKEVEQPQLYKSAHQQWSNLSPFEHRIRLNRLLAALGQNLDPIDLIPNSGNPKHTGVVLFERGLVRFSSIWGKSWAGEVLDPNFIVNEIKPLFELFRKPYNQTKSWSGWYKFETAAVDFFKFAIKATSQHGDKCVLALSDAFRNDWSKRYWPTAWRREIAFALYDEGGSRDELVSVLEEVEQEVSMFDDIHSKITEYYELSIIWSKISEYDRSSSLVPRIFKESFGINHRKDRQFSHWVSWLDKLVEQHPGLAFDEIRRFSFALISLEQSGNGRGTQEAGRDLISIATRWDIQHGLKLLKWLFKHKGLHYASGLTGFLTGMLNRPEPPVIDISTMIRTLLLPFEEYNPSSLAKQLTAQIYNSNDDNPEEQIEKLITTIRTHLLPSNRYEWLEGIALATREAGRDNAQYADFAISTSREKPATNDPKLTLKTGEKITEDESQLRISSVADLFDLLSMVESVDYCRWGNLVQPFLKSMDLSQLEELQNLLKPFNPDNNVTSLIAYELSKRGETTKADSLFEAMIGGSEAKGWDLHWDGGSKQSIFTALVEIDGKQWRPTALACLVDDYISEFRYPSNLIWNLKEIVNILFEDADVLPIWKEITDHVYRLDSFNVIYEQYPELSDQTETLSDSSFLIQFAFEMLDEHIPELAHMAHQSILEFAHTQSNWPRIYTEILIRLNEFGFTQIKVISLLLSLVENYEDFVIQFETEISSLCASEDFCIRMMALKLADELSIQESHPPDNRSKLLLVYELEVPKIRNREEAAPMSALRAGETLPDCDDPIELLRPLQLEMELLSDMSGIPFENIVYRASQLMKTLVPETEWNKESEESYREWMEGIDLKLTYNRLRPHVAKLAFSHVVCELLDAGRLPYQGVGLLNMILKTSDGLLLSLKPSICPEYIMIPKVSELDIARNHEWIYDIGRTDLLLVDSIEAGKEVVGELTKWSWLDWKVPTEIRMSTICHPELNTDTEIEYPSALFPSIRYWSAEDYPYIDNTDEPSLVIYGSGAHVSYGGVAWLALNPKIAFFLGWTFSQSGLFRWVDENGDIMVESIYWKDGPIARIPPKRDDICSNGWLVVASEEAIRQIREIIGDVLKVNVVARSYGIEGDKRSNSIQERVKW